MVKNCLNCEHHTWGDEWWNCKAECNQCKYTDRQGEKVPSNWKPLPTTNADRIRAMSDEELAEFLQDAKFYCQRNCEKCLRGTACISMLQWLKQPAEVDGNA